jgi:putative endopeptidase
MDGHNGKCLRQLFPICCRRMAEGNQIPAAFSSWGVDQIVEKNNFDILKSVLEKAAADNTAAKGSSTQMIGDFYSSCMDEAAINAAGTDPIKPYLAEIDRIKTPSDVIRVTADLQKDGFGVMFNFFANADQKKSTINIANLYQGGLSLPNRDYYTNSDDKSKEIRDKFVAHVARMFVLLGDSESAARTKADTIMRIENRLALASKRPVELRDPVANYNKVAVADLDSSTPNINWESFSRELGVPAFTEVNVGQPDYFKELSKAVGGMPVDDWKTYLSWQVVRRAAPRLAKPFDDENFSFYSTVLRGTTEQFPRWRRCLIATDQNLGEALGQEYVKQAFTPQAKAKMNQIVADLFAAYKQRLETVDWMSASTRSAALAKLAAIQRKIGYPDKLRGFAGLTITRGSYFTNSQSAAKFETNRDWRDIGQPVDKMRWGMTPPTINAYYNPSYNEIVFPAGILQPPYFNVAADDAVNYGDAGGIIGHEMTHGFDDEGSQYDAEGNLKMWWTPDDRKNFEQKADCIVEQFNNYEVLPGLKMNGKLTEGENIADLGGLIIAYNAFQNSLKGKPPPANIDGFTPEQRFFLSYTVGWMVNQRPESVRTQVLGDPHALPEWRVIGPLSNMPEFAKAFGCKLGDHMVNPKPCRIW